MHYDVKEHTSLSEAIQNLFGAGVSIRKRSSVSGGDINMASSLELSDGTILFMKENSRKNIGFFRAEAVGLDAIRSTSSVHVPDVLAIGTDGGSSFLILSHIDEGRRTKSGMEGLGRGLALMHLAETAAFTGDEKFGFTQDNYIGAGAQKNTPKESWVEFFAGCRLIPQFEKASGFFKKEDRCRIDTFLGRLPVLLTEPAKPSLLHGDFWGGNYMIDRDGIPWLIDPAVYVGHPEADLAMTELFGGFEQSFYGAYREILPVDAGYGERRDIYNLYHLLNHLNLFGRGYLSSVKAVVNRYT